MDGVMRNLAIVSLALLMCVLVAAAVIWRPWSRKASSAADSVEIPERVVNLSGGVYRVSGSGMKRLRLELDDGVPCQFPAVSPDQQWVACIRSHELWLFNIASGRAGQATKMSQPATDQFLPVEVQLLGWAADSSRVLVAVKAGEEECHDCNPRQARRADYGYYSFLVASREMVPVRLPQPFEFRAWLPDGSFLGIAEMACDTGSGGTCNRLVVVRADADDQRVMEGFNGEHRELAISPDGHFALTTLPFLFGSVRTNQSQIMKIDLRSGKGEMLTDTANSGQWQHPQFSPEGRSMAWKFYDQKPNGTGYLHVHTRNDVYRCPDLSGFQWVDEQHLLVKCGNGFDLIETDGKLITRFPRS
jgi:hypothetical protein